METAFIGSVSNVMTLLLVRPRGIGDTVWDVFLAVPTTVLATTSSSRFNCVFESAVRPSLGLAACHRFSWPNSAPASNLLVVADQ